MERGIYRRTTRAGATRYEVQYLDSDGRQRWRTVGSLRDARQLRAELTAKVGRGERVAPSKITLRDLAEEWLEGQASRLRPATLTTYRANLHVNVLPRLGRLRVGEVQVDDVARLVAELEREGKAGWTIRGCLTVLGRVLGNAERRGLIAANPVRKLDSGERPKVARREFPSLDREDVGRLIAATPVKFRTLVALSVLTALRQSEALGLRWGNVDTREGSIRVRLQLNRHGQLVEPKTEAAKRDVPIPPSLSKLLAEHRLASRYSADTDYVFVTRKGTPFDHRAVARHGLDRALSATGLPRLTWHDLRHLAASMMIEQGLGVPYIARVLGHSSPAVTLSTYAHEFAKAEHAETARERMEAAFAEVLR